MNFEVKRVLYRGSTSLRTETHTHTHIYLLRFHTKLNLLILFNVVKVTEIKKKEETANSGIPLVEKINKDCMIYYKYYQRIINLRPESAYAPSGADSDV